MFAENGPCEVIQMADGSYGTQARMWGWDRSSNVLFIDQPTQVRTLSISIAAVNSRYNSQSNRTGCHLHLELVSTIFSVDKQYSRFLPCAATALKIQGS
jgi:hypothetical protein